MNVKFRIIFFYSIALFSYYPLYAQSVNVSGTWNGHLSQKDKTWLFDMQLTLEQKGNSIWGTAKFIAKDNSYAIFNIEGKIKGKIIQLYDLNVLEEKSRSSWYWCKKVYTGSITKVKEQIMINGNWANDKQNMFSKRQLIVNSGVNCSPGSFNVTKDIEEKTEDEIITKQMDTSVSPVPLTSIPTKTDTIFLNREIEVKKRIEVFSDTLNLNFYDNGDIDNDTISVYYNKILILNKQRLTDKPLTVKIAVQLNLDNEILMFANNEGSIPPNTAILIFEDEGKRHEVKIDSDLKSSGSIYLHRKK